MESGIICDIEDVLMSHNKEKTFKRPVFIGELDIKRLTTEIWKD